MKQRNIGSSFDDFLRDEGVLAETSAVALKRTLTWRIAEVMKVRHLTHAQVADHLRIRADALHCLLDENDPELALTTLTQAAEALGLTVDIQLRPKSHGARKGKLSDALLQPGLEFE